MRSSRAANRAGGDDNITAVLFEMVEAATPSEPDEKTREYATAAPEPDEEDTLHPEDGVAPPPPAEPGVAEATVILSAEELRSTLPGPEVPETPQAGLGRRLLALLVIAALVAVIVVLVWWGLAR